MIKDAEAHADEARKLRELADTRNQAEALAYQTEKSLKDHRDKLDEAEASTIEGRIMELRGVLDSGDIARAQGQDRRAPGGLDKLAEAIYAQASAAASAPSSDGGENASDDEVIEDADYEVVDEGEEAKTS